MSARGYTFADLVRDAITATFLGAAGGVGLALWMLGLIGVAT